MDLPSQPRCCSSHSSMAQSGRDYMDIAITLQPVCLSSRRQAARSRPLRGRLCYRPLTNDSEPPHHLVSGHILATRYGGTANWKFLWRRPKKKFASLLNQALSEYAPGCLQARRGCCNSAPVCLCLWGRVGSRRRRRFFPTALPANV